MIIAKLWLYSIIDIKSIDNFSALSVRYRWTSDIRLKFLLIDENIFLWCNRYNIFKRMPSSIEDFLCKIQTIPAYFIFWLLDYVENFSWLYQYSWFNMILGCFHDDVFVRSAIKDIEEVVVTAGYYWTIWAGPITIKLIKNAVVIKKQWEFCS